MLDARRENDLLKAIPSPTTRLWAGLCIILSIFIVFTFYTIHELRGLEDYQANVVQRNRKASLQLLRLQNNAYLLAISVRDMSLGQSHYHIVDWRSAFNRIREDMSDASRQESEFAVSTPASDDKRNQLRTTLADFWSAADHVFVLAQDGKEAEARSQLQTVLESKRAVITEIVSRLLVLNDQGQVEAGEKINAVYAEVKREILIVIGVLFLLALGTGLFTFEANRKTFDRLHHLAEKMQSQSEQLRHLSWKVINLQEETLRNVARDLHDEFGQILTAIGMMLGRLDKKVAPADAQLLADLHTVKHTVEETLQSIRDRSQMFRPAILDDFGLDQSLEWLAAQFSRQTGIDVHFEGNIPHGFFPREDAIHLYRIVQESLSNVARHSKARSAWVTMNGSEGELNLEIRDDGVGFEVGPEITRSAGDGIGLMGMQERAQHLNGILTIRSTRGTGTVVSVRVPLGKPWAEAAVEKVK
ncbi:MAG TPA: sensor histidine kinase [Terriglobia bacterium]|nr:sensor histidine kinase [Terriglobia bacterium]